MNFRIEQIKEKVNKAVNLLLKNDLFLLEKNVNERSVSHKLAEYLQQQFQEFSVDCEYNRMKDKNMDTEFITKKLNFDIESLISNDTTAKTVYPDIIIHHRGTGNNLLVIEVKKTINKSTKNFDFKKLNAFRSKPLQYKFGLYIEFDTNGKETMKWFVD